MELSQIKCVMAVVEAGSFTKAAEALFLSPQTVKNQIDALELELGCMLFERSAKGAKATEEGMVVFKQGTEIVTAIARLEDEVRSRPKQSVVRLACPRGSSQPIRDRICADFKKAHPEIEVKHVLCRLDQDVVECLMAAEADVGFASKPEEPSELDVLTSRLCEGIPPSRMLAVVSRDNPLSRGASASLSDLFRSHARLVREDIRLPESLMPFVDAQQSFTDQYEAIDFVLGGGVCVTNSYMPIVHEGIVCVPIDVPDEGIYVIARACSGTAVTAFVDYSARWLLSDSHDV